jgi:alkylation response protein AidB-like acyl-CoA dehydrogenase
MSASVQSQDLVEDVLRRSVEAIDRDRRLPDEVLAALRRTGLNRMTVPVELGGDAASPSTMAEVIERVASVNGSAGWCAAIGVGSNVFAGYVPRAAAAEIWHDIDAPNASMFGPCGSVHGDGDDYTLEGRWPFVSNSLHSTWIGLGAFAAPAAGVAGGSPRLFFVPADQVTIHDTWDVEGMRGTGSHDVSVHALPIDPDRSCSLDGHPWADGPLWRIPLFNVLVPPLAAALVGIARGSLALLDQMVLHGHTSARGSLAADDVALADLAEAHADLDGARAALYESMEELWRLAFDGAEISLRTRARGLLAAQHAVDVAQATTATARRLAGSAAAYRSHPLAIAASDVNVGRQHIMFSHHIRPALARALAGCEVSAPPFLQS